MGVHGRSAFDPSGAYTVDRTLKPRVMIYMKKKGEKKEKKRITHYRRANKRYLFHSPWSVLRDTPARSQGLMLQRGGHAFTVTEAERGLVDAATFCGKRRGLPLWSVCLNRYDPLLYQCQTACSHEMASVRWRKRNSLRLRNSHVFQAAVVRFSTFLLASTVSLFTMSVVWISLLG